MVNVYLNSMFVSSCRDFTREWYTCKVFWGVPKLLSENADSAMTAIGRRVSPDWLLTQPDGQDPVTSMKFTTSTQENRSFRFYIWSWLKCLWGLLNKPNCELRCQRVISWCSHTLTVTISMEIYFHYNFCSTY